MGRILRSLLVLGMLVTTGFVGRTTASHAATAFIPGTVPRFITIHHPISAAQIASSSTLPTWSASFSSGGTSYPFTIVGTSPLKGSATTVIPVTIIPLKIVIGTNTFDGSTKVSDTVNSPLFKTANFGADLGTTQYLDAFQRAEFWAGIKVKAPNYHVLLGNPTVAPTVTLTPSRLFAQVTTDPSTGKKIGEVDVNWLDLQLSALAPTFGAGTIPVFLSYNTYATSGGGCCIGGYHSALGLSTSAQTYSWTTDTDAGVNGGFSNDINATSHELGELFNDPFVNNSVPSWNVPSQPQYGCQSVLEVGDPLVLVNVNIPGYPQYHAQDLAEFSWFARRSPSASYNGYYTFANNFSAVSSSTGC